MTWRLAAGLGFIYPLRMRKTISLLLLITLAAGGCAVQRPSARVTGVEIAEATEEGSRLLVTVVLDNPRDEPLPIRRSRYELSVDGETFEFTDLAAATMPAQGSQTLRLPAAVRVPAAAVGSRPYEVRGSVVYEPPGEIRDLLTDSGVPLPSVTFSQSGRLPHAPATAQEQPLP